MDPASEHVRTPPGDPGLRVVAVVGPTGVGKTAVAEEIAARLGGEIVSADSMQVYRGMDVGTAKPPPNERRVPYHCIDIVGPGEPYSAALYQRDARAAIADVALRGRLPVVCGGTGLYVRAALDDMRFPEGELDSAERARLDALAAELTPAELHARLAAIDPESAAVIHPNNVRRVVRALEMAEQGTSYAEQLAGFSERQSVYDAVFVGLTMDRELLYERIAARVGAMMAAGLLDEVRRLLAAGYRDALTAAQAIGYKELVPVAEASAPGTEDEAGLADAVEEIRRATRRYAKRQLTWFRADPRVRWVDITGLDSVRAAAKALAVSGDVT